MTPGRGTSSECPARPAAWPDASAVEHLNITLDNEHAEKLTRLAERTDVQPSTIAQSLLLTALDDADADPHDVVERLDGISGAYERAQLGRTQAQAGDTIRLEQL